jgi:hypothetical protein
MDHCTEIGGKLQFARRQKPETPQENKKKPPERLPAKLLGFSQNLDKESLKPCPCSSGGKMVSFIGA